MDFTSEQKESLRSVLREETKQFVTKDDFKGFATKDDLEKVKERLATTVASSFQQAYERLDKMDQRLDRMENIIDKWPPPSYVTDLLERVSQIEKVLKLKPHTR